MNRTKPLLYVVTGLSALLVALALFWIAILPSRLSAAVTQDIEKRTGLRMAHGASSLSVFGGPSLHLSNITLTKDQNQSIPAGRVDRLTATLSLGALLGGKVALELIELENPTFDLKTESAIAPLATSATEDGVVDVKKSKPLKFLIHKGLIKWSDAASQTTFAASDINGTFSVGDDGVAVLDLAGLFNGKLTRLAATLDDLPRLKTDGTPSDVTLSSGQNSVSFSGRSKASNGLELDGRLSASSDDVRSLAAWWGLRLSGFDDAGMVRFEAATSFGAKGLQMKDLKLAVGNTSLSGTVNLDISQSRPMLQASLQTDRFDTATYQRNKTDAPTPSTPQLSQPWREATIDVSDLSALDAKIDLSADKLVVAGLETGKATLNVNLADGVLDLALASQDVAGGKATATLNVSRSAAMPVATLKLEANNVNAKSFLGSLTGLSALDGKMSVKADLTSEGDSQARLISSLAGQADVSLTEGKIDGLDLAEFLSGKGKGWRLANGKVTAIANGMARVDIQDGVAHITTLSADAGPLSLNVDGEIDLLRQHIDLICKPTFAGAAKLPVQLAIAGPWTNPDVDTEIDTTKLKPKALLKSGKKAIKKLFGN
jgi:uncharacterized protein involved in outer membrane biogenesis